MLTRFVRALPIVALAIVATTALSGCVANGTTAGGASATALDVSSTATDCTVSKDIVPSGSVVFTVTNDGDTVTEFYLLADDGLRIVAEAENIGPGLSRDLVMEAKPGNYFTACKPGMTGDGVGKAEFTVIDSGNTTAANPDLDEQIELANENYAAYVTNQIGTLVTETQKFTTAYVAGDDDLARSLYAPTRMYWERVETVAESFGDLDPLMDAREADLEDGQEWTGWHAIEKDLWPADAEAGFVAYSAEKRVALADQLNANTATLFEQVQELEFTISQQANGAVGLLEEVASGKITGEEEIWSHTDLWDFQANIDGARVLYEGVRDILVEKDASLADTLDAEFASLQSLLDEQRVGDGFTLYTDLSPDEIRALSDQVNALAEPLSELTAALVL
jgi:iron uptake system component EfeO